MKNNLGREVIRELKSQRQMGRFFSYKELQKLKKIETTDQLDEFLKETNHGEAAGTEPPSKIVEHLDNRKSSYTFFDMAIDFFICMSIW